MDPQNAEPVAAAVGTLIVEVPQTVHGPWELQFMDMVVDVSVGVEGGSVPPIFSSSLVCLEASCWCSLFAHFLHSP